MINFILVRRYPAGYRVTNLLQVVRVLCRYMYVCVMPRLVVTTYM